MRALSIFVVNLFRDLTYSGLPRQLPFAKLYRNVLCASIEHCVLFDEIRREATQLMYVDLSLATLHKDSNS